MQEPDPTISQRTVLFPAPRYAPLFAWAALYLAIAYVIQFHIVSVPIDADTAYHAAVGRLLYEHGILRSFPWTPFSWLSDHYADKELLFHLLFAPLSGLGWITASAPVPATRKGAGVPRSYFYSN